MSDPNIIATQYWRYLSGTLKASGRADRAVGPFAPTPPDPVNPEPPFILETTKPGPGTAGLPTGWAPARTIDTYQIITSSPTPIENVRFACDVDIRGTGMVFNNCDFAGSPGMGVRPTVNSVNAACNVGPANIFSRCRFSPQNHADGCDSLMGFNYTLNRCELTLGGDGSGSYIPPTIGTDLRIRRYGNWVHDLLYWCPSTGHSDGHSHNDGDQHHNGTNIVFQGDNIEAFWSHDYGLGQNDPGVKSGTTWTAGNCNSLGVPNGPRNANAALQLNQTDVCDDYHILGCWISGGVSSLNLLDPKLAMKTLEIRRTRFGLPLAGRGAILNCYNAASAIVTASDNTLLDGTPIALTVGNGRTNSR